MGRKINMYQDLEKKDIYMLKDIKNRKLAAVTAFSAVYAVVMCFIIYYSISATEIKSYASLMLVSILLYIVLRVFLLIVLHIYNMKLSNYTDRKETGNK